ADVIRATGPAVQRGDVGKRDVGHVQHVACLLAIAIDGHRPAGSHSTREDGDHAPFLRMKVLARAVDVRISQDRVFETEGAVESAEVLLERELAGAIWR